MKQLFMGMAMLAMLSMSSSSTSAAIIAFDLAGNGGAGLLGANENAPVASPGSGGEVGAGITFDDVSKVLSISVG
jgi:hypothetical protein